MERGMIGHMRSLLLLLLLVGGEAHGWILGGKRGGRDAPKERQKDAVGPAKLPPSTFVRIFALPSDEAKMAQVLPATQLAPPHAFCMVAFVLIPHSYDRIHHLGFLPAAELILEIYITN